RVRSVDNPRFCCESTGIRGLRAAPRRVALRRDTRPKGRMTMLHARVIPFAIVAVLCASSASAQQSVADFYRGKTITILMGTGPGASYDLYGRTIAEHM